MSGTTKASQRAVNKYIANNYDRLKDKYKLAAEAEGKSLNAFIVECIEKRMEERE